MSRVITVEFVFENGFMGAAKILEDQPDGTLVTRRGQRLIYEFPKDGILKLRGRDPAQGQWFTMRARYRSGQPIHPVIPDGSPIKPGDITLSHARTGDIEFDGKKWVTGSMYYVEVAK